MASSSNGEITAGSGDGMAGSPNPPEVAEAPPGAEPGDDEVAPSRAVPPVPAAAASRPYYECVFCKRGFTTAQALGGHMNIHRRDRAKPSLREGATTSPSRNFGCYNQYHHHHFQAYPPPPVPPVTSMAIGRTGSFTMNYQGTGAPATTGVVDADASANPSSGSPTELSLFGAAARDHGGSREAPEGLDRQEDEPERELDLELRLGRRPSH